MAEKKKWIRYCAGECCDKCADHEGEIYKEEDEDKAKRKLHNGCECDAVLVEECPGLDKEGNIQDMQVDDLLIHVNSYEFTLGGDYSLNIDLQDTADEPLTDVDASVSVYGGGKIQGHTEMLSIDFNADSISPGSPQTFTKTGHYKLRFTHIAILVKGSYKKGGKKVDMLHACWQ